MTKQIPGVIIKKLPVGYWINSDNYIRRRNGMGISVSKEHPGDLYGNDFNKIDDGFVILKPNAVITFKKPYEHSNRKEYIYRQNASLTPVVKFDDYDLWSGDNDIIILKKGTNEYNWRYGYIDFKNNHFQEPILESYMLNDGSRVFNNGDKSIRLDKNGNFSKGAVLKFNNKYNQKETMFVPVNDNGSYKLNDLMVEQTEQSNETPGSISVKKDGKWGLYNLETGKMTMPFIFPGYICKITNGYVITSADDKYILCDEEGNTILEVPDNEKISLNNISSGIIYTYKNEIYTTGIYSLTNKKWIIEPGKYDRFYSLPHDRYAVEIAPNKYNIITTDGTILNTLDNIENAYFQFQDYTDFLKVTSTSGKMGLLNPKTGKWILQCQFDKDFTFGGGKGSNRKIALQQTTDKGQLITVYTVSGKKIASQFFPWGMNKRSIAIRRFGEMYLNH